MLLTVQRCVDLDRDRARVAPAARCRARRDGDARAGRAASARAPAGAADDRDARRRSTRSRISGSPRKPGRHLRRDREIGRAAAAAPRRCRRARIRSSSMRVCGLSVAEAVEALQQQPGREQDLRRPGGSPAPSRRTARRAARSSAPASSSSARARRYRSRPVGVSTALRPCDLERLHAEQRLELLHGVGHRRLALVQRFGRLRIAAGVDDGEQRAPLLQRDAGDGGHISNN